jgi:hypothetical protein
MTIFQVIERYCIPLNTTTTTGTYVDIIMEIVRASPGHEMKSSLYFYRAPALFWVIERIVTILNNYCGGKSLWPARPWPNMRPRPLKSAVAFQNRHFSRRGLSVTIRSLLVRLLWVHSQLACSSSPLSASSPPSLNHQGLYHQLTAPAYNCGYTTMLYLVSVLAKHLHRSTSIGFTIL